MDPALDRIRLLGVLNMVVVLCSSRGKEGSVRGVLVLDGFCGEFASDFYGGELRANAASFGSAGMGPNAMRMAVCWGKVKHNERSRAGAGAS